MSDELPEDHQATDGVFAFRGRPLEPFSFDRQSLVQRLIDDSGAENDLLVVFACLTPIQECLAVRGESAVAAFRKKMGAWAQSEKITVLASNRGRKEISRIANAIYADLRAVDFEPDLKSSTKAADPNSIG